MTTAERLARKGYFMLSQHGWPEEAAKELANIFMEAGAAYLVERMQAEADQKEALIQRVEN